jgi:hypothetical protein
MDGQYETLLKAEMDGAEVYYVAPRFADWSHYIRLFGEEAVLEHSVMVTPGEIRDALVAQGCADGQHRIVYDRNTAHVCSVPKKIRNVRPDAVSDSILKRIHTQDETLAATMRRVYAGLEDRSAIRREQPAHADEAGFEKGSEFHALVPPVLEERLPRQLASIERLKRFEQFLARSKSEEDALAAAIGLEFWGLGIQLLFAVEQAPG